MYNACLAAESSVTDCVHLSSLLMLQCYIRVVDDSRGGGRSYSRSRSRSRGR